MMISSRARIPRLLAWQIGFTIPAKPRQLAFSTNCLPQEAASVPSNNQKHPFFLWIYGCRVFTSDAGGHAHRIQPRATLHCRIIESILIDILANRSINVRESRTRITPKTAIPNRPAGARCESVHTFTSAPCSSFQVIAISSTQNSYRCTHIDLTHTRHTY